MRQIKILSKLELINFFSLNVIRHSRDKKSKKTAIALGITLGFVLAVAMFYIGGLCYGYIKLGAEEIVPVYIVFLSSVFTLLFCVFKAGKIIFKEGCYDILVSMPIKKSALVISRYIRLYVEGVLVSGVVMLLGTLCYACMVKPGIMNVILGVFSVLVVPVIPVTLSVLLGVIITGVSSKMKNKVLFETLFVVILVIGMFALTAVIPTNEESSITLQNMESIARDLVDKIYNIYPLSMCFAKALVEGSIVKFVIGVLISVALFAIVIFLTIINFEKITRKLHTSTAKHNYKLGELEKKSMMKAIVLREGKRYFSSETYVTNTIIGPFMAVAYTVSLFFVDLGVVLKDMPVDININAVIPVLFAGIMLTNSPIATSVSMEGKEFWIIRTLPVSNSDILKAKLVFNAMLLAPFYVVGEVIMIIALRPGITELVWMIMLPLTIICCALVLGLFVNLKFPKLKWDSDVEVVKQSASALIGGFSGFLVAIVVAVPLLIVPVKYYNLTACVLCVVVVLITVLVNEKNRKFNFKNLE